MSFDWSYVTFEHTYSVKTHSDVADDNHSALYLANRGQRFHRAPEPQRAKLSPSIGYLPSPQLHGIRTQGDGDEVEIPDTRRAERPRRTPAHDKGAILCYGRGVDRAIIRGSFLLTKTEILLT